MFARRFPHLQLSRRLRMLERGINRTDYLRSSPVNPELLYFVCGETLIRSRNTTFVVYVVVALSGTWWRLFQHNSLSEGCRAWSEDRWAMEWVLGRSWRTWIRSKFANLKEMEDLDIVVVFHSSFSHFKPPLHKLSIRGAKTIMARFEPNRVKIGLPFRFPDYKGQNGSTL